MAEKIGWALGSVVCVVIPLGTGEIGLALAGRGFPGASVGTSEA